MQSAIVRQLSVSLRSSKSTNATTIQRCPLSAPRSSKPTETPTTSRGNTVPRGIRGSPPRIVRHYAAERRELFSEGREEKKANLKQRQPAIEQLSANTLTDAEPDLKKKTTTIRRIAVMGP